MSALAAAIELGAKGVPCFPCAQPTEQWQDKSRGVRPGQRAEEFSDFSTGSRGALSRRTVGFAETRARSILMAPRLKLRLRDRGRAHDSERFGPSAGKREGS
jgi:hypothetical protein